ncbi:MAG: hypothetical protein ACR2OU_08045 [Thermomicrobiales bacterium]
MSTKSDKDAYRVTGVSNIAYDLNSLLHNKLEEIVAFEKYKADCENDQEVASLFAEMEQRDKDDVQRIKPLLANYLGS